MGSRTEYVNISGLRVDGRRPAEVRRIRAQLGIFPGADGSALYEQGNTQIIAAVHGPKEMSATACTQYQQRTPIVSASASVPSNTPSSSTTTTTNTNTVLSSSTAIPTTTVHDNDGAILTVNYSIAPFSTIERRIRRSGDRKIIEISTALRQTLETVIQTRLYPRSEIVLYIQVLQSDGNTLAAAINAGILALINAGIAINDFIVGCSLVYIQRIVLLDPNYTETTSGGPELTVALLNRSNKITLTTMDSRMPIDAFAPALEIAMAGCRQIYEILHSIVVEHTTRQIELHNPSDSSTNNGGDNIDSSLLDTASPDHAFTGSNQHADDEEDQDEEAMKDNKENME